MLVSFGDGCALPLAGLPLHGVDHMQRVFHRDALALVGELLGVADAFPHARARRCGVDGEVEM